MIGRLFGEKNLDRESERGGGGEGKRLQKNNLQKEMEKCS